LSKAFDIVVVGSGIAGLSAGLAAARLGRSTLILTGDTLGGQLLSIEKIDGYPGFADGVAGYDLCPIAQEQATAAGAEFAMTSLTGLERTGETWRVAAAKETYTARSVILATGTACASSAYQGVSGVARREPVCELRRAAAARSRVVGPAAATRPCRKH
jgi:thioredoxin reductase (NADPH)